jgi:hypothetical protein
MSALWSFAHGASGVLKHHRRSGTLCLTCNVQLVHNSQMTDLHTFQTSRGVSDAALAAASGCDRTHMSTVRRGLVTPSLRLAFAIEDATGGEIPARYWADRQRGDE